MRRQRWLARTALPVLSLALSSVALGAALTSESSLGLQVGYNANPNLIPTASQTQSQETESVAVLANLPLTYSTDASTFDLLSLLRFGKTHGAVGLLPDYQHVDGGWQFRGERNRLVAKAGWHHDATFYGPFENAALQGRGLRRTEGSAGLDWKHDLSERSDFTLVASGDKVTYSPTVGTGLADYRYSQGAAQYERLLSERWLWTNTAGFARFEYPDGSYRSDNRFLQISMNRQLSERWTVTAQAGYSDVRSLRKVPQYKLVTGADGVQQLILVLVDVKTSRGSGNFSLGLESKGQRLVLDLSASRAIQPSGLGDLVTQDDVSIQANMPWTERLTLGATVHGVRIADSLNGPRAIGTRSYYNADLSVNWQMSERWTVQLQGSYRAQKYSLQAPLAHGLAVNLSLSRGFGRLRL